jgi:hypothetical protein
MKHRLTTIWIRFFLFVSSFLRLGVHKFNPMLFALIRECCAGHAVMARCVSKNGGFGQQQYAKMGVSYEFKGVQYENCDISPI